MYRMTHVELIALAAERFPNGDESFHAHGGQQENVDVEVEVVDEHDHVQRLVAVAELLLLYARVVVGWMKYDNRL